MDAMKKKELEVRKKKAEAAISELEYKLLEREQDMQRIKEHIKLQQAQLVQIDEEMNKE